MLVLAISDTHLTASTLPRMPAMVWTLAARADAVLHAGDITDVGVLDALRERAPVHAVLGNNDHDLRGALPEVWEGELGGVPIAMVHDSGPRLGRERRMARRFPAAALVVFGHSHEPLIQAGVDGQLLVNPGSPVQRRRQPVHTVAWLELAKNRIERAEMVPVGTPREGRAARPGPVAGTGRPAEVAPAHVFEAPPASG